MGGVAAGGLSRRKQRSPLRGYRAYMVVVTPSKVFIFFSLRNVLSDEEQGLNRL